MTVADLIDKLSALPGDLEVVAYDEADNSWVAPEPDQVRLHGEPRWEFTHPRDEACGDDGPCRQVVRI